MPTSLENPMSGIYENKLRALLENKLGDIHNSLN
jgi:hypothetical protein